MKAIIFDFFGVVHDDPLKLWLPDLHKDAHPHVAAIARQFDLGNIGLASYLEHLAAVSSHDVDRIRDKFATAELNHETVNLLDRLRIDYKLCLLSNAHIDEIEPILQRHGLREYFDHVVISSEVGMAKPDAGIFEHALERLGLPAHEVVFVDDSAANVTAANALGLHAIHFNDAEELEEQLACVA